MPLNTVSESKIFRGLTCPYTGKLVTVRVVAAGRDKPRYFSPDAFDPSAIQPTAAVLLEKIGTRNGVMGALTNGNELFCPYTGQRMSIRSLPDGGGYYMVGGFNPSVPVHSPEALSNGMRMRDGKPPAVVESASRVAFTEEREPVKEYDSSKSPDYALEYAEKVLKPGFPKRAVVTVGRKISKRGGK